MTHTEPHKARVLQNKYEPLNTSLYLYNLLFEMTIFYVNYFLTKTGFNDNIMSKVIVGSGYSINVTIQKDIC